jgi:hypothetical protein
MWEYMDKRLYQGLIGFAVLCVTLSVYLGLVVREGPKPVHELRQALLNGVQFLATEAICRSGARAGGLKQAETSAPTPLTQ